MNITTTETDPLYEEARRIIIANPDIGKKRLGVLLGIRAPSARRRIERYRGETQGHSTNTDYIKVRQLKDAHPEWGPAKMAEELGMSMDHAMLHLARWLGAQSYMGSTTAQANSATSAAGNTPARDNELEDHYHEGGRDLSYRGTRIQTMADVLEYAKVDLSQWEVTNCIVNKYEVAAKTPGGMITTMLYQIKVWLCRRVLEEKLQGLMLGVMEQFKKAAPIEPKLVYPVGAKGLLEVSIMDQHLGKYCAEAETGRAYNIDIAERIYLTALEDLIAKSASLPVEQILFVCGNDFLNIDKFSRNGPTTERDTVQDESVRYQESFLRGRKLLVSAIQTLRKIAPVKVMMVTGNHDTQRLYYLGDALECFFHRTPGVEVDNSPRQRKYFHYRKSTLIGFTHGHNEKHFDLPLLLATEQPQAWAESTHREFHLGHFHSKKHKMFVPTYDRAGVLVRILPSLCPPDAWHTSMGYNARLAAEALYFDPEEGCVANFTHSPN
jgi:hypothetical protein